jgi:protein-tyrosine phosphatase
MKYVLFLCTANFYRSRFAEELFNGRAPLSGLNWSARSRALAIERVPENGGPLSPYVMKALGERGICGVGLERYPQQCSTEDLESADLIIALKEAEHRPYLLERFAGWEDRVTYWHVHDIDVSVPTDALASLDHQIETLIRQLQKNET